MDEPVLNCAEASWVEAEGSAGLRFHIDEDPLDDNEVGLFHQLSVRYSSRCLSIFEGRTRNVFNFGKYVVKVPKNFYGVIDNEWEGCVSNSEDCDPEDVQYARTRLDYWKGVPVVFMEYVEYASDEQISKRLGYVPEWTMSVDCGQVGFNRKGRLVAYDYGLK